MARSEKMARRTQRRGSIETTAAYFVVRFVVVTGGSSGICLRRRPAAGRPWGALVLVADGQSRLDAAVTALGGPSAQVSALACDIGDPTAIQGAMATLLHDHGTPDVLVNNAGFAVYRAFEQSDEGRDRAAPRMSTSPGTSSAPRRCSRGMIETTARADRQHRVRGGSVHVNAQCRVRRVTKAGIVAWSRALTGTSLFGTGSVSRSCARAGWKRRSSTTRPSSDGRLRRESVE